jgi:transaldolase
MNNLLHLINYGQSYWLDNLTREKIENGELKRRILTEGLRGVTTNPSIFNKPDKICCKLFPKPY